MASSTPHYTYEALPAGPYFRYLVLQPGQGEDPLQCSLQTSRLDKACFEAISYVWGDSTRTKHVLCDDRILDITSNLDAVLRRVRLPDDKRVLWVDQICIDQDSSKEKGHQVSFMGQIYRQAKRTLIYMGTDDQGQGENLISLLEEVNQMIANTYATIEPSWDSFPWPEKDHPLLSDTRWNSVPALCSEEWWKRGWVVQEAALAQEGVIIWGDFEIKWDSLLRVSNWLFRRGSWSSFYAKIDLVLPNLHWTLHRLRSKDEMSVYWPKYDWQSGSILENLDDARLLELRDPRDRIYAFLELTSEEEKRITLEANYNSDHYLDTYKDFALEYISTNRDIKILNYVIHNEETVVEKFPSWIPRWDLEPSEVGWQITDASWTALTSRTGTVRSPTVTDEVALKAQGVIFDSVRYASDLLRDTELTTIAALWQTVVGLDGCSPYSESSRPMAFSDALSTGRYNGNWTDWKREEKAYMELVCQSNSRDGSENLQEQAPVDEINSFGTYLASLKTYTWQTRFIITKRGYVGLAPQVTRKGDLCAIIFGCRVPCILRKTEGEVHYKFLGSTYITGKNLWDEEDGYKAHERFGTEDSQEWTEWDVKEEDIVLR